MSGAAACCASVTRSGFPGHVRFAVAVLFTHRPRRGPGAPTGR
jgi:hypothetical protein